MLRRALDFIQGSPSKKSGFTGEKVRFGLMGEPRWASLYFLVIQPLALGRQLLLMLSRDAVVQELHW